MADVRIAQWHTRYRMQSDALTERSRFDRMLRFAIDDELFGASLERAGLSSSEEICIRRVDADVRLESAQPDARLAVAWSVALADAIALQVSRGGPDVVRYSTRYLALVEMACQGAQGELERAWAWRSLGIWRAGDVLDAREACVEVLAALAREPRLAMSALGVVARRGILHLLVSRVPVKHWLALSRAVLTERGANAATIEQLTFGVLASDDVSTGDVAVTAAVQRVRDSSAIADAVVRATALAADASLSRVLALMAMLEAEPSLLASVHAHRVVQRLATQLTTRIANHTGESHAAARAAGHIASERVHANAPQGAPIAIDDAADDERVRGITQWGGLLFLLHLVHALELPAWLQREGALDTRSLRWSLHQLALLLVPAESDDPATLAFAGAAPGTRISTDEPPATDPELRALREAHAQIVAALRDRMAATSDESDVVLVRQVTSRRAEIVAERGWIEIHLSTEEISITVRRVGLDLDPGWIPWLGVVVRFVYG